MNTTSGIQRDKNEFAIPPPRPRPRPPELEKKVDSIADKLRMERSCMEASLSKRRKVEIKASTEKEILEAISKLRPPEEFSKDTEELKRAWEDYTCTQNALAEKLSLVRKMDEDRLINQGGSEADKLKAKWEETKRQYAEQVALVNARKARATKLAGKKQLNNLSLASNKV